MHMEITERCDSVSDFVSPMWKKGKSRKQRSKKMAAPVRPFSVIGSSNPQELHVDLPKRPETSFYKIETNFLMTSNGDGDGDGVSMLDFVDDEGPLSPTEHPRYLSGSHLSQFYGLKTHQIHSRVPHWRRHIEAQVKPVNGEHSTMKIVETTEKWLCLYEELYKATIWRQSLRHHHPTHLCWKHRKVKEHSFRSIHGLYLVSASFPGVDAERPSRWTENRRSYRQTRAETS